jgi:hypothetical protein
MTTNESREALIEKTAKAIADVRWNHALPHANRAGVSWTDADLARAALAVFEKVHTPTDDELTKVSDRLAPKRSRRPVSPEPTNDLLDVAKRIGASERSSEDFDVATHRPISPEPSAERTGPCGFSLDQCRCDLPAGHDGMHECSNHRFSERPLWEPQTEPTDARSNLVAEIDGLIDSLDEHVTHEDIACALTALRAVASSVQGEN